MGVPYEIKPSGGHFTSGSTPLIVTLDVPSRCRVYRLAVVQVNGGPGVDFTVDVFNNLVAAQGNGNQDDGGNVLPPTLYKVTDTFNGSSGKMLYFADKDTGGFGFPFYSLDPPNANKTVNTRKIYVVITVPAAGPGDQTEFAVAVGLDSEMV